MNFDSKETRKKHIERLKAFRLLDDDFMTKCFEGNRECIELILRIIMDKPDLKVREVHTQHMLKNLQGRSVKLDVFTDDIQNKIYDIEIQRKNTGAGAERARYNSSIMDVNTLAASEDFSQLPETYVIFITENDIFGKGLPIYRIERCILETGEVFHDGSHIIYVNGAYRGDTPIGKLMHDFFCTNPSDMHYKVLADRTRYFKEDEEGVGIMCEAMEEMRQEALQEGKIEGRQEGVKEMVLRMLKTGKYALEEIMEISGLSLEEVTLLAGK